MAQIRERQIISAEEVDGELLDSLFDIKPNEDIPNPKSPTPSNLCQSRY